MEEGRMASAEFDNPQPDIEIRDVDDHQVDAFAVLHGVHVVVPG